MVYWNERIRSNGEHLKVEKGVIDTVSTAFNGYNMPILDSEVQEDMGKWEVLRFSRPNDPDDVPAWTEMVKEQFDVIKPTIALPTSSGCAMVVFYSENEKRSWMDLLCIDDYEKTAKFLKRMSVYNWQSFLHQDFKEDEINFDFFDAGDDRDLYDGNIVMSYDLAQKFFAAASARGVSVEKVTTLKNCWAFNIRILTPWGIIKGDVLVAQKGHLPKMTIRLENDNLKKEVMGQPGMIRIMMLPQEQSNSVRTNRPGMAIFHSWLFKGHVERALRKDVDELISSMEAGEIPAGIGIGEHSDTDSIASYEARFLGLLREVGDMRWSLFLTAALVRKINDMMVPPSRRADERKYRAPFAIRRSLRNYTALVETGLSKKVGKVKNGEFILTVYGVVMSDATWREVGPVLGGADFDDHVEIHFRVAGEDGVFEDVTIKKGDVIGVFIRNPIGISSDGKNVGVEYYILKADARTARWVRKHYNRAFLPMVHIDPALRPAMVNELEERKDQFVPVKRAGDGDYSKDDFFHEMELYSMAQKAYGTHVNLMVAFAQYGIPFEHFAPEEVFADCCQQGPLEENVLEIMRINDSHKAQLEESGVCLEALVRGRVGIYTEEKSEIVPHLFHHLRMFHVEHMQRFNKTMKSHLSKCWSVLRERFPTPVNGQPPLMFTRIKAADGDYRKNLAQHYDDPTLLEMELSHRHFAYIGDWIADAIDAKMDAGEITREEIDRQIFSVLSFVHHKGVTIQETPSASKFMKLEERFLCNGRFYFDFVLPVLKKCAEKENS